MERIRSTIFHAGPSITFFRDDVEEILAILNAACEKVTISDGTYSFGSLDELIGSKGSRPKELSLRGVWPYVSLSIKPMSINGVRLWADESEDSEIPFLKVKEYLRRRAGRLGPPVSLGMFFALVALGFITNILNLRLPGFPEWIPMAANSVVVLAALTHASATGYFCRLRLERRHEATTFWSRNGERLIVGLIGVMLGALGKELVTWVAHLLK